MSAVVRGGTLGRKQEVSAAACCQLGGLAVRDRGTAAWGRVSWISPLGRNKT